MSNLRTILTRLVQENLHGPIGPKSDPATKQKEQGPLSQGKVAEPTQGEEPEEDLDAHDPRWRQLFQEFFLSEHSDDRNDDLLFFVQRTTQLEIENGMEPVFVKRKVHGISTPASSEGTPSRHGSRSRRVTSVSWQQLLTVEQERNVLWKDTFFLNVIVQVRRRHREEEGNGSTKKKRGRGGGLSFCLGHAVIPTVITTLIVPFSSLDGSAALQIDGRRLQSCYGNPPGHWSNQGQHDPHTETDHQARLRSTNQITRGCQGGNCGVLMAPDLLCHR